MKFLKGVCILFLGLGALQTFAQNKSFALYYIDNSSSGVDDFFSDSLKSAIVKGVQESAKANKYIVIYLSNGKNSISYSVNPDPKKVKDFLDTKVTPFPNDYADFKKLAELLDTYEYEAFSDVTLNYFISNKMYKSASINLNYSLHFLPKTVAYFKQFEKASVRVNIHSSQPDRSKQIALQPEYRPAGLPSSGIIYKTYFF